VFSVHERLDGLRSWYVIREMPPLRNRMSQMRALVEDWWRMEWEIWKSGKIGWMASTDKTNHRMLRIYPALGAHQYGENKTEQFFMKAITKAPPAVCPTLAEMVDRIRGGGR
jgi:hypothetical protein